MALGALWDILFPPLCHLCRTFIHDAGDVHICSRCQEQMIPITSPICSLCGAPFATEDGIDHRCGRCLSRPPDYAAARAAFVFQGPVQELIHRFKYEHKTHLHRPLSLLTARLLTDFASHIQADLIIPVPLHWKRLRWRSYNQSLILASVLAKQWRLQLVRHNLRRTRWTEPQINLAANERETNVRGAFSVVAPGVIAQKRIVLVDDVLTTGSTVEECARTLKMAGAAEVFVVTIARAA